MTTEAIYSKYWAALMEVDAVMVPADTAIALALRLAVADAYCAGSALADDLAAIVASQAQPELVTETALVAAQSEIALLREELAILESELDGRRESGAAWVAEIDALRQQLAQMDADNADLLNKVQQAQSEIDRLTRQNGIATDTFNSLAHSNDNGNGAEPPTDATVAWWAALDAETNDWRISLDAGRRTFRQLNKRTRLSLLQAFARHVGNGNLPTQAAFDAARPSWMPGGSGLVTTFGCAWTELLTLTPFEVEP